MIPQLLGADVDVCELAGTWGISVELATRLVAMSTEVPFSISIISGFRSREQQLELEQAGRPTAPDHLSTHRSCPATGADLWPAVAVTDTVKASLGAAARLAGLRWGGGSPIDPGTGIPLDWNHVDLGPRRTSQ